MEKDQDKVFDFGVALAKFCTEYAKCNGLVLFDRQTHLDRDGLTISLKAVPANHEVESSEEAAGMASSPSKRVRHEFSEEERERRSERMKAMWAEGRIHGRPRLTA